MVDVRLLGTSRGGGGLWSSGELQIASATRTRSGSRLYSFQEGFDSWLRPSSLYPSAGGQG